MEKFDYSAIETTFSWQSRHRVRELVVCINCPLNLLLCYKTICNLAAYRDNHFIVYLDVMGQKFRLGLAGGFFCSLWYWGDITWWYSTLRWVLGAGGVHNKFTVLWLDVNGRKVGLPGSANTSSHMPVSGNLELLYGDSWFPKRVFQETGSRNWETLRVLAQKLAQ